jgi:hypothetical protein
LLYIICYSLNIPTCYLRIRKKFLHIWNKGLLNLTKHIIVIGKVFLQNHAEFQKVLNGFCVLFRYLFVLSSKNWRNRIIYKRHNGFSQVTFALNVFIRNRFLVFDYADSKMISISVFSDFASSLNYWNWIYACSDLRRLM